MMAEGTLDEHIFKMLKMKNSIITNSLDGCFSEDKKGFEDLKFFDKNDVDMIQND